MLSSQRAVFSCIVLVSSLLTVSCASETDINSFVPNFNYTCKYFVDSQNGSINNDGMSISTPWRTFDQTSAYSRNVGFKPGDAICFKRGQRFTVRDSSLGGGSNGARDNFIFYGAYGEGAKPRLSAALRIDSLQYWLNDETLTADVTTRSDWRLYDATKGIYLWPNASNSWQASGLWEDNKYLRRATALAYIGASTVPVGAGAGNWFYEYGVGLYYKPTDGQVPSMHEIYFAKKDVIVLIHQASNLVFKDLSFEYASRGIAGGVETMGSSSAKPIHNVAVVDCEFDYMSRPVELVSKNRSGIRYENHDLIFRGNVFDGLRIALHLHSSNTDAGVRNVEIANNTVRNVAVNGDYVAFGITDVEVFSLQNPVNVRITGNDIRNGVKLADGIKNKDPGSAFYGNTLRSFGVVAWTAPGITMRNVLIENNFMSNLHAGVGIGVAGGDTMRNVALINNIVVNSEIGLKMHAISSNNTYISAYNTLFNNDINLELGQLRGQALIGNISANPGNFHVIVLGFGGTSTLDYNGYTDGNFRVVGANGNADIVSNSLLQWQQIRDAVDTNSVGVVSPRFSAMSPTLPDDFMLTSGSQFVNMVPVTIPGFTADFGGRDRLVGGINDAGAWEHQ